MGHLGHKVCDTQEHVRQKACETKEHVECEARRAHEREGYTVHWIMAE